MAHWPGSSVYPPFVHYVLNGFVIFRRPRSLCLSTLFRDNPGRYKVIPALFTLPAWWGSYLHGIFAIPATIGPMVILDSLTALCQR